MMVRSKRKIYLYEPKLINYPISSLVHKLPQFVDSETKLYINQVFDWNELCLIKERYIFFSGVDEKKEYLIRLLKDICSIVTSKEFIVK
ncbi:hypothetical protein AGMMS49992_21110 [Clostridia bacterium]|nr:hypothetical protein AGMMS49992_21110 [Clostridia bacterium]